MPGPKPIACPMCSKPAMLDGKTINCEHCDAIYTIIKEGGAKVKKVGVWEDHEERLQALESSETAPEEQEELEPSPAPEQPEEDEEIFPE